MAEPQPFSTEGLYIHTPELFVAKMGRILLDGPDGLHVVADWDRTLAENGPGPRDVEDINTWRAFQSLLEDDAQTIERELNRHYYTKEQDGSLTQAEAEDWWATSFSLHVGNKTHVRDIAGAIDKVNMHPRDGAVELFQTAYELGVPTVILSAGVRIVIEWITRAYNMKPTAILATKIKIERGRVIGWEDDTLIHSLNKREMGHGEIAPIRQSRPNVLLLGDDLTDSNMVEDTDEGVVLRIQVKEEQPSEKEIAQSVAANYDAIVVGSLMPVVGLVRTLANT